MNSKTVDGKPGALSARSWNAARRLEVIGNRRLLHYPLPLSSPDALLGGMSFIESVGNTEGKVIV
jgi:hypothetical protein